MESQVPASPTSAQRADENATLPNALGLQAAPPRAHGQNRPGQNLTVKGGQRNSWTRRRIERPPGSLTSRILAVASDSLAVRLVSILLAAPKRLTDREQAQKFEMDRQKKRFAAEFRDTNPSEPCALCGGTI